MLALITALVGFLGTLVLTIVLMSEFMPRFFAEWQRGSRNRLVLVGFCMFAIAWIGAYIGYRLGSSDRRTQRATSSGVPPESRL